MRALAIAATGMDAQQTNLEVIANNIANINTTAFKRARAEFTDLLYQAERPQGVPQRGGENPIPEGANIGLGVRTAAIRNLHMQGTLAQTGNRLDLALNGRGWFQTNANGELVTLDGYQIEPAIALPPDTVDVVVNESGQVYARVDAETEPQLAGQLSLATFANDAGLEPLGGNLYRETTASGAPAIGVPADPGMAKIQQGYLESSNVDPVKEITQLISAQRAYEMNSKVIQAADEMAGTVSKGMR
jgi:flagellar basal-body rod protein FlgG